MSYNQSKPDLTVSIIIQSVKSHTHFFWVTRAKNIDSYALVLGAYMIEWIYSISSCSFRLKQQLLSVTLFSRQRQSLPLLELALCARVLCDIAVPHPSCPILKGSKECSILIFSVAVWSYCSQHLTYDPEVVGSYS